MGEVGHSTKGSSVIKEQTSILQQQLPSQSSSPAEFKGQNRRNIAAVKKLKCLATMLPFSESLLHVLH